MSLYTERHGMRLPIEKTSIITPEMYSMLFDCCRKYYDNLSWKYPVECPDGQGCCGMDYEQFFTHLKFDIPTLLRDSNNNIIKPNSWLGKCDKYDQYALLDLIELIGQNCRDIVNGSFHSFFKHYHIRLLETDEVFDEFQKDINEIFEKTGLLFKLTSEKIVERVIDNDVASSEMENTIQDVSEVGTKELLQEAYSLYKQPNPASRKDATEKIWDAFERLKTYYHCDSLDKKASAKRIVDEISGNQSVFTELFNDEFKALTNIGNNYRIRHHETDKIDITDNNYYDYFFNRCLSLIALAVKYLGRGNI